MRRRRTLEDWQAMVTRNIDRAQGCAVRMIEELAEGDAELDDDEAQSFEDVLDEEISALVRRYDKGWN